MKSLSIFSEEDITQSVLKSYSQYLILFSNLQSLLLTNFYKSHQSIEKGSIVLFFNKEAQRKILRNRDYDLNFDLSFIKFWENHSDIVYPKHSISDVALKIGLPKETIRRNILQLTHQKILSKEKGIICFMPNENYKNSFRKFTEVEINQTINLIKFVSEKLDFKIDIEVIKKEFKKNFSFYWLHFLEAQIDFLKEWRNNIKDLDLLHIYYRCHKLYSEKKNLERNSDEMSLNTELISELTGIPRATCLRKLEKLFKIKSINQNKFSKRYFVTAETFKNSRIAETGKSIKIIRTYCKFYYTCIKALDFRT